MGELVTANFERVRGMVDVRASRYGLSADERAEALQRALVKLWHKMVASFDGTTMGEWVNATRTLVDFVCRDVQRDAARRSQRETTIGGGAPDPDTDDGAWKDAQLAQQRHAREQERADAAGFVDWALARLGDDRRRLVLQRTLEGAPANEIAGELGVSMDNLYAIRSRAVKDMRTLRDTWYEP